MSETAVAVQADRSDEPNQLQLRFFAVVDGFKRRPPERALWRVLIDTALAKTAVFTVRGRPISAEAVHHVALALYMQADPAGVIHDATEEHIAEQCRMRKRSVSLARQVLNDLRVIRSIPRRGRRPGVHRMNLGGLDWPAVRRRAGKPEQELVSESQAAVQVELVSDQGASPSDRCGATMAPQSAPDDGRCGATMAPQTPRCGATMAPQTPRCGATMAPNGLRTTGLPTTELRTDSDPDLGSERAGRQRTAREPARRPDEPASEQQVAMLMSLQRKHRLPSQHVSEEEARTWTRAEMSEALSELENLEERRGRTPTREELLRLEEMRRYQQRYGR